MADKRMHKILTLFSLWLKVEAGVKVACLAGMLSIIVQDSSTCSVSRKLTKNRRNWNFRERCSATGIFTMVEEMNLIVKFSLV